MGAQQVVHIKKFVAKLDRATKGLVVEVTSGDVGDQSVDSTNPVTLNFDSYSTWLLGQMVESAKSESGVVFGAEPPPIASLRRQRV